ncbi:MAG: hypothetical protein ACLFRL_05345 [Desulfohalobiaceae bacterium]
MVDLSGLDPELRQKLKLLQQELQRLQPGILAVSGGVDSRLLAWLIKSWGLDFRLVFFSGPHLSPAARDWNLDFMQDLGLAYQVQELDPLQDPQVAENSRQRCYFCKLALFGPAARQASAAQPELSLLEGSHLSDLEGHRPGLQALRELEVQSPFVSAGLNKEDIRSAAQALGLKQPRQPSRPCLLTRFAYGLTLEHALLQRLGRAEDKLQALGLQDFRLRVLDRGTFCLQIKQQEKEIWMENQEQALQILEQENFAGIETMFSQHISGFFDSRKGNDSRKSA